MSQPTTSHVPRAPKVAPFSLDYENNPGIDVSQAEHRVNIINDWGRIEPGSRVLELGCGQGNCTEILAHVLGPQGIVDAVDPAPLDYGAPVTLGEAQAGLSKSPIGDRIRWHRAEPIPFLEEASKKGQSWDVAVLAHCIWYFNSPTILPKILRALVGRAKYVCIAEYALHATHPASIPHLLASLARAGLEAHKLESDENIQTIASPDDIKAAAGRAGWKVDHETMLVPGPDLLDGKWETGTVVSNHFLEEIETHVHDGRAKAYLRTARDTVLSAVATTGNVKATRTMDVWTAVLSPADDE